MPPRRIAALTTAVTLALSGCSDGGPKRMKVYPVTGKVLWGGKPADKAMVVFHPLGTNGPRELKPLGVTGADGTYRLTSYVSGDGAPEGEYVVTVNWPEGLPTKDPDEPPPDRLKGRYANPAKSPWKVAVSSAANEIDLNLR
jgi:hypothetical protein